MKLFTLYNLEGNINTYLVGLESGGEAIIIDPGHIDLYLLNLLEDNNYYIKSILITHDHEHHTKGVKTLMRIYDPLIYSKRAMIYDYPTTTITVNSVLNICGLDITVIEIPGHSDDSLVFRIRNALFTGDILSAGKIGYTPNSVTRRLLQDNIKKNIFSIKEDLIIFPGHGPPTTIRAEKEFNSFMI
ncbi:MAG: MBL fold metallo-hydrolase [Spirochaetaceae bacterium]|nr:MBL fold metallo-hydrolase [Spirochaetaceae bacterium]